MIILFQKNTFLLYLIRGRGLSMMDFIFLATAILASNLTLFSAISILLVLIQN